MKIEDFKSGCVKQENDPRDRKFKPKAIPWQEIGDVDLRQGCSTPRAQGEIGSCTAFASTSMFDFVRRKHSQVTWKPSPLFTYYATRVAVSSTLEDSGATIRDAIKSTVRDGVSMERAWPYVIEKYNEKPPEEAWLIAEKHQTLEYLVMNDYDRNEWMNCLHDGYPFIFGINLYQSFFDPIFTLLGGYMQDPDRFQEKIVGAHCMMAVGYIKDYNGKSYLIAQNSWGTEWGDRGYCYIPMTYVMSNDTFDFWTIRYTETTDEYASDIEEKPIVEIVDPAPVDPVPEPVPEPVPIPEVISPVVEPVPVVPEKKEEQEPKNNLGLFLVICFIVGVLILFLFL